MHADEQQRFARRFATRITCARRGHAWRTVEITLGAVWLLRHECSRCGAIGRLHPTPHRHVETPSRAAAG